MISLELITHQLISSKVDLVTPNQNKLPTKVQESFLQNVIMGLILVGYFASHVMCRKLVFVSGTEHYRIHWFIIRLTHANVWESMRKPCSCTQFIKSRIFYSKSCENPYQYCKSRENPYQVLQVTRESVSGTTSHARIRIRYYKSRALRMNVQ